MATTEKSASSGLEGVIVADTALSEVDGERGRLILHGYELAQIAEQGEVEDIAALLWYGRRPDGAEREAMRGALGEGRSRAYSIIERLGDAIDAGDGMDALRASLAHLPSDLPAAGNESQTSSSRRQDKTGEPRGTAWSAQGALLVGAAAVFAAAWWRRSLGQRAIAPDPSLSHAADYLRMMQGHRLSTAAERALSSYLVTVADHGMNASTFAARVVASTGSDSVSAVVAAVGALKGPLHGGAPGPVLDMLDAVGEPQRAEGWIESELEKGRRIMGMGHRIYRVRDPRAAVLESAIEKLAGAGNLGGRLALARAVEQAAARVLARRYPDRALCANVEFYTAVLLDLLGISRRMFSSTFAVGRVVGWYAHIEEQRATGRLIRPASRYVGPTPDFIQSKVELAPR